MEAPWNRWQPDARRISVTTSALQIHSVLSIIAVFRSTNDWFLGAARGFLNPFPHATLRHSSVPIRFSSAVDLIFSIGLRLGRVGYLVVGLRI
jgi:hypothetical protein